MIEKEGGSGREKETRLSMILLVGCPLLQSSPLAESLKQARHCHLQAFLSYRNNLLKFLEIQGGSESF